MAKLTTNQKTSPLRVEEGEDGSIVTEYDDVSLKANTGFSNIDASHLLVNQLGTIFDKNSDVLNGSLAMLHELAPTDPIEAMLCSQLVSMHCLALMTTARLYQSNTFAIDPSLNRLVKMNNIQSKLLDALHRHRHGGRQTMTVQHVNVSDGGQAIIGSVTPLGEGA